MKSKTFLSLIIFVVLILPTVSFAEFVPLVGIPGVSADADFSTYINTLYALSISIAGLLAVIKIIIAGVKWMLSDVVTSKQEAKSDIQGALFGLLVVISAVLVLNIINPQLTKTTLFVSPVDRVPGSGSSGPGAPASPTANNVRVINPKIDCTPVAGGKYNCVTAFESCTSGGGVPSQAFNINGSLDPSKVSCRQSEQY